MAQLRAIAGAGCCGLQLLFLLLFRSWSCAAAAGLPVCAPEAVQGRIRIATGSCKWPMQTVPSSSNIQLSGEQTGVFPGVMLSAVKESLLTNTQQDPAHGFSLTIKRVVLLNVTVAPSTNSTTPKLLPLGLFSVPVTNLSLMDVRFSVAPDIFQQYLTFFSRYLLTVLTKTDGGVGMHTDGTSFLNIPYWSDNSTELSTVTIMTGPCIIPQQNLTQPIAGVLRSMADVEGCNVRSVSNDTLIPILRRDATINTTQPLLVRLISNVTLGANVDPPIVLARPVLIIGASSSLVSVDLGMVVNQFNVTRRNAQLSWQSVVLENIAPGDALSATLALPYSTTVTLNLWPVLCNRSRDMCLPLTNVTLVVPSADEVSYLTFMSTMYNSPSPSLRELAGFYYTDLKMTAFDVAPGPANDSLKILRLVTNTWNMWYCTMQTQPVFAPQLPAPRQVFNQLQYRTGVVVHAISDCSSLQATQGLAANRVHVWQLTGNTSIGGSKCALPPTRVNVSGPTTLIGDIATTTNAAPRDVPSMRHYPLGTALPSAGPAANSSALQSLGAAPNGSGGSAGSFRGSAVYALGFQYTAGLIQLPPGAGERYFQIRNITLHQLPQARDDQVSASGSSSARRLMQGAATPARNMASVAANTIPPGSMTLLLWAFNRSLSGSPLIIADAQLVLPQPEWQLIAQAANNSRNFAIELQDPGDLIFTGVDLEGNVLTVASFQGPGISGTNVRLLPDQHAAAAMPGYHWPVAAAAAISGSGNDAEDRGQHSGGLSRGVKAAIGACVGVLGALLVALGAVLLLWWRKLHRQQQQVSLHDQQFKRFVGTPLAAAAAANGDAQGGRLSCTQSLGKAGKASPSAAPGSWRSNISPGLGQDVLPGDAAAGAGVDGMLHGARRASCRSSNSSRGEGCLPAAQSISEPLPVCDAGPGTQHEAGSGLTGSMVGSLPSNPTPRQLSESEQLELTIAQGLQQWNNAVSMQTIRLMQQRLQASSMRSLQRPMSTGTTGSSIQASTVSAGGCGPAAGKDRDDGRFGSVSSSNAHNQDLQLYHVIGVGSFGAVHLGSWRGKQVAVKVMHLPAHAFTPESSPQEVAQQQQQRRQGQQGRQQHMRQQNSRQHMAMMEAVLSTSLHHPNVVQVFTYMLAPLMANNNSPSQVSSASASRQGMQIDQQQEQQVARDDGGAVAPEKQDQITGWSLQLVMEYCDQGTLRDQLDRRELPHLPNSSFLHPAIAVALSHDIAAAMLHLHKEGIVHGDLKAGNVLLQASTTASRAGTIEQKQELLKVWMGAGCLPLVAKVADFGLALPLQGDTHATLHARGTPTHMAPELFTWGHVSKSSDVFAFGILLYEIVTGQRAYAGVPVSLLPHRVAVEGLRPAWPTGVPCELMRLAEACWVELPQNRPCFQDILSTLEKLDTGSCVSKAAVTGPVGQPTGVKAPTAAAVAAASAAAAAAAVSRPATVTPPLPSSTKPKHQHHQHDQQQQQHVPQGARGVGVAQGQNAAAKGALTAGQALCMDWSEVQ